MISGYVSDLRRNPLEKKDPFFQRVVAARTASTKDRAPGLAGCRPGRLTHKAFRWVSIRLAKLRKLDDWLLSVNGSGEPTKGMVPHLLNVFELFNLV